MLSEFNAGCNCDCCIVYKSEFCDGHYESAYQRDNPFGVNPNIPSSYPLNGGGLDNFGQVGVFTEWTPLTTPQRIWNTTNNACGFDDSYCATATDAKGFPYAQNIYLNPTTNLLTSHLLTKVIADKFQWYLRTFWNAESDSANQQTIRFFFDYVDDENWLAVDIKYDPDFGVSPGAAQRYFVIQGKKNSSGTVTNLTSEITYDNGLGDAKADNIDIEFNIEQRSECGSGYFVTGKIEGFNFGFEFTPINGDYIGLQQVATSNVISSEYCLFQDWAYTDSFGVYSWVHRYLDSEKTGCADYTRGCCDCYVPSEIDVTFSGFTSCDACVDLNDTFTLIWNQGSGLGCTHWGYDFDAYSPPSCTVEINGKDTELQIKRLTIDVLNNVFTLRMIVQIFVEEVFGSGDACDDFIWRFTEGTETPPPCTLTSSDSWSYVENNSSNDRCKRYNGSSYVYFNLDDFCDTGYTVTVENG